MMRDEVLRALCDPREVADAQLVDIGERARERQPCGVRERVSSPRKHLGLGDTESVPAKALGHLQVETQQAATIVHPRHPNAR